MMRNKRLMALPLLLLAACDTGDEQVVGRTWIAPVDGQTAFAPELPVTVYTGDFDVPPDYPINEYIWVDNLDDGGRVEGEFVIDDDAIRFWPDAPWAEDTRYAFTVQSRETVPHGPELALLSRLEGTAAFETSDRLRLIAASYDNERDLCLILSRALADGEELVFTGAYADTETLTIDGVAEATLKDWVDPFELDEGDPGVGFVCMTTDGADVGPESTLRLQREGEEDWLAEVQRSSIEELYLELRRTR